MDDYVSYYINNTAWAIPRDTNKAFNNIPHSIIGITSDKKMLYHIVGNLNFYFMVIYVFKIVLILYSFGVVK